MLFAISLGFGEGTAFGGSTIVGATTREPIALWGGVNRLADFDDVAVILSQFVSAATPIVPMTPNIAAQICTRVLDSWLGLGLALFFMSISYLSGLANNYV
ncbi:MAG: hypothetical protein HY255_10020 [Betaproteobacteria bacterium]|nr:hypothetical protein [Betaproteobacteria bacterium]